jgi:GrpB-like predicted nucleotidyltransferase (UPF0157 family)
VTHESLPRDDRLNTLATVGNPVRVVEVVTYDPTWPEQFETERRLLADVIPQAVSIEHIGSTSVPGLAAKPIIDIIAVVPDVEEIAADVSALEGHGYVYRPWCFADDKDHLFFPKDTAGKRTHHLHVLGTASPLPQENRMFRDYLATHAEAARRYDEAKRRAADLHPDSRAKYGEAKEAVMFEVIAGARQWAGNPGESR